MRLRGAGDPSIHKVSSLVGKVNVVSNGGVSSSLVGGDRDDRNKSTQGGSATKHTTVGGARDDPAYNFGVLSQSIRQDFEEAEHSFSPLKRGENQNKTVQRINRYRK